jgi:hypothetical protein
VHQVSGIVADDLHFDMPCIAHEFLEIHLIVAESCHGFTTCDRQKLGKLRLGPDHAHAATAATPARFQHHRVPDVVRHPRAFSQRLGQWSGGRHDWHTGFDRQCTRGYLVAEQAQGFGSRADQFDTGRFARRGEFRILRQESIARMNGISPGFVRNPQHIRNIQIGLNGTFAAADGVRFVCLAAVQGKAIFSGINCDRSHAQFAGCAHHSNGDFATVRDQDSSDG